MITVEEALAVLDREVRPGGPETVCLEAAAGRVLAAPVRSDVDWPPFDTSAMDGYAVRMADVPAPGASAAERPGSVGAGDPAPGPLAPGEAVRVMTGAPIPAGTEAVVPVELVRRHEGRVLFSGAPAPGAHLRRRAESVAAGTTLLTPGLRLTPGAVALAALAGAEPLTVFRRPITAVAATGNELVDASERPGPGKLRDSNGPMLAALCYARGISARREPRRRDDAAGVADLFDRTTTSGLDVLVTSGGVSAGDFDLLPAEAVRQGFTILFHGVAMRPGKPVAFGRRGGLLWFGLPGNPVSASVCFHLLVRRAFDLFEGLVRPGPERVAARLSREARSGARETWRDAVLSAEGVENRVEPLSTAGSHDIATHARANALVRIPAGGHPLPAGAEVECIWLERG